MLSETLPLVRCKKCGIGTMLPLSDYGQEGAAILYKAWVCDSPTCGYNLRIDRGQATYGDLIQQKPAQESHRGTAARAVDNKDAVMTVEKRERPCAGPRVDHTERP